MFLHLGMSLMNVALKYMKNLCLLAVCQLACCKQNFNYEELFNLEILQLIYRVVYALFPCRPLGYLCVCIIDASSASGEKLNCSTIANCLVTVS